MKKYTLIIIALTAVFQLKAQYTIQVGNGGNGIALPYTNQHEYNWCTVIYPQDKIKIGGDITKITYRLQAGTVSSETTNNQEVYMAHTADVEFSDAGYPETASMTLVYQGSVEYYDSNLGDTEITLPTPFAYNNSDNLIVHLENHDGNKNSFSDQFLYNYSTTATNYPCKYNQDDGSFPETTGSRTHESPNIRLTFDSGLDAGISKINNNRDFLMPGLQDVVVNFSNYMADVITSVDIEWEINGIPRTTYNWTGSLNPGEESAEIIIANDYDFSPETYQIKAWTSNPNSGLDELNTNDTLTTTITVADYIEIADDSYTGSNSWLIPFYRRSWQSWSASIINKDSVYLDRKICGIAYNVVSDGSLRNNQTVFLSHVADNFHQTAAMPDETSMTNMFSGTVDYAGTGWKKIPFDNMFEYNNSENIMIYYTDKSNQWQSPGTAFDASVYGGNVGLSKYNDASQEYPTGDGVFSARLPNIRLYCLIPSDAGITALNAPGTYFSTGNNNILVSLKNYGTDTLTSANIKYQIDNGTIQTFNWTGDLPCYDTIQNAIIGNESFSYGEHTIKIWTDTPNGLNDYKTQNDTLIKTVYATNPLCGNYVIGEAPSDYTTIKEAIDTLNSAGISCDVVFDIKPGSYNAQYLLNEINDAGQNSTVTFQSQTGDSTDVILTTDSTDYLFNLNGADNIAFKKLTFTSESAEKFVVLDSGACNNIFENNQFIDGVYQLFNTETTIADTNNTVHSNLFLNGHTAVYFYSVNGAFETGNIISSNTFENQTENSIKNAYQENLIIRNNNIETTGQGLPIYSSLMKNCSITKNTIISSWAAMEFLGGSDTNIIANNFIVCESNTNMGFSIRLGIDNAKFYNNTIKSIGDQTTNSIIRVYGDNNDLKNNVLINLISGQTIEILTGANGNLSDYNCLYTNGESLAGWQNTKCADLETWQSESGLDANSISSLPIFTSETDLHTNSIVIDGAGTPLTEVTDDIDGDPRDISTPDIGADEFTSTCTGPISGTYTVGSSGDYATFNDALTTLFECGVSSSVTFNIEAGTYNEQVLINEFISGFTENDTIIFQSATGDSTDVILTYKADTINNYTLKLNGADRFVFKQITIHAEDTTYGRAIEISNGACNNLIKNCVVSAEVSDEDNNYQALVYFPEDSDSRDTSNVIQGNRFINGSYGLYLSGNSANKSTFNTISANTFTNQSSHGIYTNNQRNLLIEKNIVENNYQLDINYCGISINSWIDSAVISKNRIDINRAYNSYGLQNGGDNNLVINNFISVSSNNQAIGVFNSGRYTKIYNNSIHIPFGSGNSSAIQLDNSTGSVDEENEIMNNNLSNNAEGYAFYSYYSENKLLSSDFNNLYSKGDNIVFWGGSDISNISEWQTASGFGNNSVSSYPNFISDSDLHTSNVLLNNAATPLPEVTDDIDGESRDATAPDIGADEFTEVTFSLEDDITVCVDAEYKIDAGEGFDSYLWSTGADSSYILVDSTGIGYGSEKYFVTVTLGEEQYNDSITVSFSSPIAMSQDYFCADASTDSVLLTANEGVEYYWSTGETTQSIWLTETYVNITVTDANGCQGTEYISRQWNSCPADFKMPEDTTILINDSIVIDANPYCDANYDNYAYLWSTGDTTETITVNATALGVGAYTYSVSVTNNSSTNICITTDQINVEVSNENAIETLVMDGISLYPNPTNGIIMLEFHNTIENTWVRIINVTGREVYSEYLKNYTGIKTLNLSGIDQGIYIISVQNENTNLINKIIIY